MPYCPKCRTEYRAGFDTCADCHVPLVEGSLPQPPPLPDPVDYGDPALLTTTDTELEADMFLALLEANNIPAQKKYLAAGGYLSIYMGATSFGIKIYVPEQMLAQAQDVVESWQGESGQAPVLEIMEEDLLPRKIKGKILPLLLLLYILSFWVWYFCYEVTDIILFG